MKIGLLLTAFVTVIQTIALAQAPDPALTDAPYATLIAQQTVEPEQLAQPADAFAPLSNAPFFPGGMKALEKHLENYDLYPDQARLILQEGTVRVQFRVQPSGQLTDIEVVKSKGSMLDQAAVRAVATMPRWYPAHRAGMAVSSVVVLPITFRLD